MLFKKEENTHFICYFKYLEEKAVLHCKFAFEFEFWLNWIEKAKVIYEKNSVSKMHNH